MLIYFAQCFHNFIINKTKISFTKVLCCWCLILQSQEYFLVVTPTANVLFLLISVVAQCHTKISVFKIGDRNCEAKDRLVTTLPNIKFRKKLTRQSKEIKQKQKGLKAFNSCFSVIFSCYGQSVISGRETGCSSLLQTDEELATSNRRRDWPHVSQFSKMVSQSVTREETHVQNLLYQKLSPA